MTSSTQVGSHITYITLSSTSASFPFSAIVPLSYRCPFHNPLPHAPFHFRHGHRQKFVAMQSLPCPGKDLLSSYLIRPPQAFSVSRFHRERQATGRANRKHFEAIGRFRDVAFEKEHLHLTKCDGERTKVFAYRAVSSYVDQGIS